MPTKPYEYPQLELSPEDRFGIVVSRYNDSITQKLLDGAIESLRAQGVSEDAIKVAWVPGAWEIPLIAQQMTYTNEFAAIICLGVVIQGETTHDKYINRNVSSALIQTSMNLGIPVAFGLLTCPTRELAEARAGGEKGNKGAESAEAAVEMVRLMKNFEDDAEENFGNMMMNFGQQFQNILESDQDE